MNKPLILDFAISRNRDGRKQFEYDYSKDLNIININGSPIIFIESDVKINEAQTETRADRERDDEDSCFLEMMTKTETQRERDDEEYCIQEVLTKTAENRERDDEEAISMAELISKTFSDRERDDEDDFIIN